MAAKEAGITILNEVGVDPGIDHLYAVKVIGEIHEKGGKVSTCLPYLSGLVRLCLACSPLPRSRNSTRTAVDCRLRRHRTTAPIQGRLIYSLAAPHLDKSHVIPTAVLVVAARGLTISV